VNSALERGKRAEREVVALIAEQTGWTVRRRLAGRVDDVGDLEGLPECCVQIKSYTDIARGLREGLEGLAAQTVLAGASYGVLFLRRRGGRYAVVMEPETLFTLLREATS
jgi:hypothetical protein